MFQKNDLEGALTKFQEVQLLIPEYEEVGRYLELTKTTLAGVLFEQSQVNLENGNLEDAVAKLKRASQLAPSDSRVAAGLRAAERDLQIKNAQTSVDLYKKGLESFLGGDTAKAEQLWKKSLEMDPNNEEALKAISKIEEQKKYGAQEPQQ
jgi:tetratricopeptide (TPR) repeat protein